MSTNQHSRIVVEDNGCGMTPDVIKQSWMNPAAPHKHIDKKQGRTKSPEKKRIIQGEKGIGRFAILKLGSVITVTTWTQCADFESVITYDFAKFDEDFTEENHIEKEMFLDQIQVDYFEQRPSGKFSSHRGTSIEIQNLKGAWSESIISGLNRDIASLTDPVSRLSDSSLKSEFEISVFFNGKRKAIQKTTAEELKALIDNKAVLKIHGRYDAKNNTYFFTDNGQDSEETGAECK